MQPTEAPAVDPAARVGPAPCPTVPWRVVRAKPLPGMRLEVGFADGTSGQVHLQAFLESRQVDGTVFEQLRDDEAFRQVRVELGAVVWPGGADLAPDAMYDAIRSAGHWDVEG